MNYDKFHEYDVKLMSKSNMTRSYDRDKNLSILNIDFEN